MAEVSRFLQLQQIPRYVRTIYQTDVSPSTLKRWKKKHPITFPTTPEEFDPWFEERMTERALKNSTRIFHSTGFHRPAKGRHRRKKTT